MMQQYISCCWMQTFRSHCGKNHVSNLGLLMLVQMRNLCSGTNPTPMCMCIGAAGGVERCGQLCQHADSLLIRLSGPNPLEPCTVWFNARSSKGQRVLMQSRWRVFATMCLHSGTML
eukprot:6456058-Amphidinium_carterae.1